jgi:hypothetical protein
MKAALKDYPLEKLDRIILTQEEYYKVKNDEGEIKWQGYMYDVARLETTNDFIVAYVLRDEAETSLLAFLGKVIELTHSDEESPPNALTEFSALDFMLPIATPVGFNMQARTINHYSLLIQHYQTHLGEVPAPPPRIS